MKNATWLAVMLSFALVIAVSAADLKITGPSGPIECGELLQLQVEGIDTPQLPGADVDCWPMDGVTLSPGQPWKTKNKPYIQFMAKRAGEYKVRVTVALGVNQLAVASHIVQVGAEPIPPPPPPPPPDENPYQPALQWKALVEPVSKLTMSRSDATATAAMFDSVASSVIAGACSTTDKLRAMIVDRGKPLGIKGKYKPVQQAYEAILTKSLSLDVKPLDKPEAAALLRSLAWATWEAGR